MRIALLVDSFPPLRSSAAVLLRDLAAEFAKQGHNVCVMVASPQLTKPFVLDRSEGVEILRLKAPATKDVGLARRAFAEIAMPFALLSNLQKSPLASERWDGVIWYSPTIFLGLAADVLRRRSGARCYLIVRDIFPEWAVNMGILRRGLAYRFFKLVEAYQYSVADVIGAQSESNRNYFARWASKPGKRFEVLQNWLAPASNLGCPLQIQSTILAGRKIFVYAGNMGVAQGMDRLLDLAARLQSRDDLGFLFVGRGSEAARLAERARAEGLTNVVFEDEIDPKHIAGLYSQCHAGLVALDPRHKTDNVPGKFLSYMDAGLPVLAAVNPGNDMIALINESAVGRATGDVDPATLLQLALEVADLDRASAADACRLLARELFSPEVAVSQIVKGLMH